MSIGRFLNHRVSIIRQVGTLDDDVLVEDEYGQPTRTPTVLAAAAAAGIQPKSARELAAISQAGVASSTHTIYLYPQDIATADTILHDPDACPVANDLPEGTYQVTGVPDAVGAGHHIEVDAFLVASRQSAYAVAAVAGS